MSRFLTFLAVALGWATWATLFKAGLLHAAFFQAATDTLIVPRTWASVRLACWYAVPLLTIVLAHELGHWVTARKFKVQTHGIYLLPWPFHGASLFGALGACVIRESSTPTQRWWIAFAGPLAGFLVTIPCLVLGLAWSPVVYGHLMSEVEPFSIMRMIAGKAPTAWHPLATAGYMGLCLTAINLAPIPGLDGWAMLRSVKVAKPPTWALASWAWLCLLCWV